MDLLQQKVRTLQDDNKQLRVEATRLAEDTTECEERENSLMHDVIKQLGGAPVVACDVCVLMAVFYSVHITHGYMYVRSLALVRVHTSSM